MRSKQPASSNALLGSPSTSCAKSPSALQAPGSAAELANINPSPGKLLVTDMGMDLVAVLALLLILIEGVPAV